MSAETCPPEPCSRAAASSSSETPPPCCGRAGVPKSPPTARCSRPAAWPPPRRRRCWSNPGPRSEGRTMDAVELEVLWGSLINTVNEQARALQRAAFSPIVREAGDLANALFDRSGRMVAQAVTGTPGHINSLAIGAREILSVYPPDTLQPGDVLITNDPYLSAGQLLDVTVLSPVWRDERVIAFFGSTIHHTDNGGCRI